MASELELDALLSQEPRNIEALVAKGDHRSAAGDERAATAFYKAALRAASQAGGALPMSLKPAIERAQQGIARAEQSFREHLEQALAAAGLPQGPPPPRFQQALDILNGRAEVSLELQRPTSFYYPGLPQRRYFDASEFPWAAAIEAAAHDIRNELLAEESAGSEGFSPYLVSDPNRPRYEFHGLRDNPEWSTLQLWEKGQPSALAARFPLTMAAIEAVDLPRITVRAPNILFSKLTAGARIPPHHGMLNTRLVCHLPLIVPPGCGFRVGGETRAWEEGKLLIFDDTIEHEAWNAGNGDRTILIFDAWRPELDAIERQAVAALFEAVDGY
jgi:aspartyl/asparaginyl beta-hydroxylase (cupin superfamily)